MASSHQQQYLRSLLSHCGPGNLPYAEELHDLIEHHLLTLTQDFPSLVVLPAIFLNKDGTVVQLLQADGTIPVKRLGSSHDIPVTIWLLETYPVSSPLVIVSPDEGMRIKPSRLYISKSGFVSLPYLDDWTYPHSNLSSLVQNLRTCFGHDVLMLTNTDALHNLSLSSTASAFPRRSLTPSSSTSDYSSASPSRSTSISSSRSSSSSWSLSPASSTCSSQSSQSQYIDPTEVFKKNAIKALSERVKQGLEEHQRMHNADMKKLEAVEAQLKVKNEQLMHAVNRQRNELESLEGNLQFICINTDLIKNWPADNRRFHALDIDIDDVFAPSDTLSKQMLENLSRDLALEDVLYSLDKAVQQESLSMDAYLKYVRLTAHEQFCYRATAMKIEDKQRQVQIHNMAARHQAP